MNTCERCGKENPAEIHTCTPPETRRLELLRKYISWQAEDHGLWFEAEYVSEAYLQQELRRLAWLIEDATEEQIQSEIDKYVERI